MPDEPTMEEMLQALEAMYFEWFSNGPKSMPIEGKHKEIYQAIRRRIERKVSREWVEKWAKKLNPYSEASLTSEKVIAWNETYAIDVVAMLKELGYEVDNA